VEKSTKNALKRVWHGVCERESEPTKNGGQKMKKVIVLALGAILAMNIHAEVQKESQVDNKKAKVECKASKAECRKRMAEERVNNDIEQLSRELELNEEQSAKFATVYREFAAEKRQLHERYKARFAQDLDKKQVRKVMHFRPCGKKHARRGHDNRDRDNQ
jgi:hypothetical protein